MKTDYVFGIRAVIESLRSGKEIDKVLIKRNLGGELLGELMAALKERHAPFQFVPVEKLDRITSKNHQGVVAYISAIEYQYIEQVIPMLYEQGKVPLVLVLDYITDVRNFGSIARSAECAGVNAIIIPDKGAAQINADAIKTSAGALLDMNICRVKSLLNTIKYLSDSGLQIIAASEKASDGYSSVNFAIPSAIIMGSEDTGVSIDLLKIADKWVRIPVLGKIASLNVAVATGVVLYEAVKQRSSN